MKSNKITIYKTMNDNGFTIKKGINLISKERIVVIQGFSRFLVSKNGSERTKIKKQRSIHAKIECNEYRDYKAIKVMFNKESIENEDLEEIIYNPFLYDNFIVKSSLENIFYTNNRVFCFNNKVYILKKKLKKPIGP